MARSRAGGSGRRLECGGMRTANTGQSPFLSLLREFPALCLKRPGSPQTIPDSDFTGNFDQTPETLAVLTPANIQQGIRFAKFPVIFPDKREFARRDGFVSDCVVSQPVASL
jgi:hypothetical protein